MMSYTLSPWATRSTWKKPIQGACFPEPGQVYTNINKAGVFGLTMECPRCSETLSDRYSSFPSPVRSIRNPGSACMNSDSSWRDRNPALPSAPAPGSLPENKSHFQVCSFT